MTCPFCGAKEIIQDTPFLELKRDGKYGPITTYCCGAQKKNQQYINKHYGGNDSNKPKDVSKL